MRINTIVFNALIGGSITFGDAFKNVRRIKKASPAQVRTQDSISSLPNDIGSNPFKAADERALQAYVPTTCDEADFVDCDNGYVRDGTSGVTCADACDGNCCEGNQACDSFTGKVCKDGSCSGTQACKSATIPEVINSCKPWGSQSGDWSCLFAGAWGGNVEKMVDSCLGHNACYALGREGEVGDLTNSCHSVGTNNGVCQFLGRDGSVGDVTSSCYGSETCYELGRGGDVGPVTNSCGSQVNGASVEDTDYQVMGNRNCYQVDYNDGGNTPISNITNCCSDADQCSGAVTDEELIGADPTCAVVTTTTTTTTTVASSWSLGHDAENSGANFTSVSDGNGDEGEVTSAWTLQGPDLSTDTNDSYTLKTIIKGGFCSGNNDVDAQDVDSTMVSGGLIDQVKVDDSGVGETKTCSEVVTSGGSSSKACVYQFDKSSMNSDVGYNAVDGKQRLCEIAQLQWNNMVIMEEYMNVEVTFNLTAGFTVSDVAMTAATIEASTADTSLADYISASQCGPNTQLAPNDVLCIRIASSSPDVLIVSIDEMDIAGTNSQEGDATLEVYDNKAIKYSAITSETDSPVDNGPPGQRIEVRTRVPTSTFNFEATGATIDITGSVTVQFAGSRRLVSVDLDRLLQANEGEETAEFGTTVNLASEPKLALEDGDAMMNSAKAMKAFATFGMVFAFTFALW